MITQLSRPIHIDATPLVQDDTHGVCRCERVPNAAYAGLEQSSEMFPRSQRIRARDADRSNAPEHAVVDFVSYLDDVRQRSCVFELAHYVRGVNLDLSRERVISQVCPDSRYRLATGICPCV